MENHNKIRAQFPLLSLQESRGRYVYLDNSATTQKPEYVIKSLTDFYTETNSNVHRGIHKLSNYASILYEKSHDIVADFIGAAKEEVFFVKNCTDGLNYLASSFADSEKMQLRKGDVIVLNELEHHSNILPWMRLAKRKEMHIEWVSITANFTVDLDHLADLADKYQDRLKIVALGHVSNVLGIRNDISKAAQITHKYGGIIVVDAAQSIAHLSIDVKHFDIDFLVFSGHKIYSPLGVGVVYGKLELLEILEPAIVGGGMIADVAKDGADWIEIPWRFEAGTPSIADGIGLASGLLWFQNMLIESGKGLPFIGIENVSKPLDDIYNYTRSNMAAKQLLSGWDELVDYENNLMKNAIVGIQGIAKTKILGPDDAALRYGVLSFSIEGIHPHDIASMLDEHGIAIRAGMHCAHLLHKKYGINASTRISFGIYNNLDDIDYTIERLNKIVDLMI